MQFRKVKNTKLNPLLTLILMGVFLASCASPYKPKVDGYETKKSCNELDEEMQKLSARIKEYENDGWLHPTYILVLPAVISKMRYNDAIEASQKRMVYIEEVMDLKDCFSSSAQANRSSQLFRNQDGTYQLRRAQPKDGRVLENEFAPTRENPVLLHTAQ